MSCQSIPFQGYMAWNYLDLGPIGLEKDLEGMDLIITGKAQITIGYSQSDTSLATPAYEVDGDTLPGIGMLPFPMKAPSFQLRLTFLSDEPWQWFAANLYLMGEARGGT